MTNFHPLRKFKPRPYRYRGILGSSTTRSKDMSDPTDELVQFDAIIAQYRAEPERLNYVRGSINVYLRSSRRHFRLMEEHDVALGDQTIIASWLGRESVGTTQVHIHADFQMREKGLSRITVPETKPGRNRPDDKRLPFLEAL
jgi:hypothetical protein